VGPSLVVAAWAIGAGLSAIRATTAEVKCVLLRLLAGLGVDHELAKRYPALVAGVGTLSLVVVLSGWVRWERGRLLLVHSVFSLSVGRAPGCATTCGAIPLSDVVIMHAYVP
jgi:hypothetical protein